MPDQDARIEAAEAAIQDVLQKWWDGEQDSRKFASTLARAALAAADAVGSVGVSEATIRVCFAELESLAINAVQQFSAADPVAGRRLNASEKIKRLEAARERWIALLTNQPAAPTNER